jgi:CheY-like chemotaxis protein
MPSRVLVIDDDTLSRDVFAMMIAQAGHTVETSESGDDAISYLRTAAQLPEVVLTDLQMPGTAGRELARQLRALCGPAAMLLAMSASAPDDGSDQEFDGLLLKPFTVETLAAALAGRLPRSAKLPEGEPAVILDEKILNKFSESMRPPQIEKLYELCLTDVGKRLTAMREAALQGDETTYKREAHAVKGSCGMVGARELQTLATSMEKHGFGDDHVASLQQFLLAQQRLRGMLVAREIVHNQADSVLGEDA